MAVFYISLCFRSFVIDRDCEALVRVDRKVEFSFHIELRALRNTSCLPDRRFYLIDLEKPEVNSTRPTYSSGILSVFARSLISIFCILDRRRNHFNPCNLRPSYIQRAHARASVKLVPFFFCRFCPQYADSHARLRAHAYARTHAGRHVTQQIHAPATWT